VPRTRTPPPGATRAPGATLAAGGARLVALTGRVGRLRRFGVIAVAAVVVAAGGAALARGGDEAGAPVAPVADVCTAVAPPAAGHSHTFPHPPYAGGRLAAAGDGFTLGVDRASVAPGRETTVELRLSKDGSPARVTPTGGVPMHVYLVADDLGAFEHVHPTPTADCGWQVTVRPPSPGSYSLVAQFHPAGRADTDPDVVLARPLAAGTGDGAAALPVPARVADAGPYRVAMTGYAAAGGESLLTFTVSRDGKPVRTISPYVGEMAHVSAFRAGTPGFTHGHALQPLGPAGGPRLTVPLLFPGPGAYRVFVEFRADGADGQVRTAAFTLPIS
jgi:hypothetical protein